MIKVETYTLNGEPFTRTYSDSGHYVVRDGISYEEAHDPARFGRMYTEGDPIPTEPATEEDYAEVGRIMMGVEAWE